MTQTLYIFRGLPASGKSTVAQGMVDKSYGQIVRVERDMLRDQLFNNRFYSRPESWTHMTDEQFSEYMNKRETTITSVQEAMASTAIKDGKSVIISDTNLKVKVVKKWIAFAKQNNVIYEIVDFDEVTVEQCIERDKNRPNSVGEEVIRRMAKQHFVKGKLPKIVEPTVNVLTVDPYDNPTHLPEAVIVDIDGTLSKMADRSPYDWSRVGEDTPIAAVIDAVQSAHASGKSIIFMSGRDSSCRPQTIEWLQRELPIDAFLYMRPAGDNRKDDTVKYELFNNHVRNNFHVKYVLDDRDQVVRMWRALGLNCFQVAPGNF